MPANINELKAQLADNIEKAQSFKEKASSETGLTDEDRVTVKEYVEECQSLVKRIEAAKSDAAALDAIDAMFAGVKATAGDASNEQVQATKSIGGQFVDSDEYQAAVKDVRRGEQIPKGRRVDPVAVNGMFKSLMNTTTAAAGGALVNPNRLGVVDVSVQNPRIFRTLVDVQTSDSPLIEFVRRTFTNNAAETVQASATTGTTGQKPESGHTFEEASTTAVTIAHWEPLTRRMLNNRPQVAGIVEGDLLDGLEDRLETQLLNGDGTGANLTGVANTSGIGAQVFTTDIFTTLLKAKTQVRVTGRRAATAHVLTVEDMEEVLLARYTAGGAFIYGGPAKDGPVTIWGLPAIESEVPAANTAYTADWKTVKLYDVEAATIAWTDSHSDFFTRNIEVVRAEMDVALAVFRPSAIVEVATSA